MNILFFDTETTGTPKNYKAAMSDLENWPRVIQLAYQIADLNTGKVLVKQNALIKPDGWLIPKEKFWIDNGFCTEQNEAEGCLMPIVLDSLVSFIIQFNVELMVAHNIDFDYYVLGSEMLRYKKTTGRKIKQICTMQSSIEFCAIPGHCDFKYPKLIELYRKLFQKDFDGAHDADVDVTACRECFFELFKKGIINI